VEPDALKLNVGITKKVGTRIMIEIVASNGKSILQHQLDAHEIDTRTRFNLSFLQNGTYQLETSVGKIERVQDFRI